MPVELRMHKEAQHEAFVFGAIYIALVSLGLARFPGGYETPTRHAHSQFS